MVRASVALTVRLPTGNLRLFVQAASFGEESLITALTALNLCVQLF
jgi:hypothetical protein